MKRSFKLRYFAMTLSFLGILAFFQNCSRFSLPTPDTNLVIKEKGPVHRTQGNGGIHSGKPTKLSHHKTAPICQSSQASADEFLILNFLSGNASHEINQCLPPGAPPSQTSVNSSEIFTTPYDPHYAVFQNKIFADEELLSDLPTGRPVYWFFCYNVADSIDFALLRYKEFSTSRRYTLGIVVNGGVSPIEVIRKEGDISEGTAVAGATIFTAIDGSYTFDFEPINSEDGQGTLELNNQSIDMDCYRNKSEGD